jgi:hypothetical protein
MSERSMLKDVSRLSIASVYTIKSGRVKQERYWKFPQSYTQQSFKKAAEQLTESLKESARLINSDGRNPLIEFTMGQDSRTVLAAFTNQGFDFKTAIYGKESFHEVIGVNKINQKLGFKSVHISLQDSFVNDPWAALKDSILLGSAEEPAYLMGRILYMRSQYPQFSTLALNGVHGRFYKDGTWNEMYVMNLYREPKSFNIPVFIKYRALNKNYNDTIFNNDYKSLKGDSHSYFQDLIENSISDYKNSPVAMQVDKFDIEHYAVFGMMANNICNYKIDLLSPLLFRRNLESALSMPAQWKYNLSNLQRQVVFNLDQRLAIEKTDFGGLNMMPKNAFTMPPFLFKYWYTQSKKFRDKIKNMMGFHVKTQLQKAWDYKTIYQNFYFSDEVQSFLNYDTMALSGILDKKEWQNLKERFYKKEYQTLDNLEFILKLFTVEYFLKNIQNKE